eukprot:g29189.t1
MALGVNQILQGLTYYAIVHTLVENRSPSCGYALLVIFQAAALAVAILDISGLRRRALLAVQATRHELFARLCQRNDEKQSRKGPSGGYGHPGECGARARWSFTTIHRGRCAPVLGAVGTLPATLAALAVHSAERNEAGVLDPGAIYYTSPAMFFLQACWLELLLWVAKPSQDDAALPRRFRTVLFLDVFGDGAALAVAAAAVKRWEAAPRVVLSETQSAELTRIRIELQIWRRALKGDAETVRLEDDLPDGRGQADLETMLRGVFAVPWRICAVWRSRLAQAVRGTGPGSNGIELATPLVERQTSGEGRVHHLAGPHAKHFVPERLPWQVLRGVTRILQFSWTFVGDEACGLDAHSVASFAHEAA